jgi:RNA polymerase sigma-70 factor (ECF subfamily)
MRDDACDAADAAAGCPAAFARLYDRHAPIVLSVCRRRASPAEAEDSMQETFLRAYRSLDKLDRFDGFGAWVIAIARRVCADRRRATTRRHRYETAAGRNGPIETEHVMPLPDALAHTEQLDRLSKALDTLLDDERLAIHLHYLDTDPQEAAAVLGRSRSGYYKLLTRARKRLASIMMKEPLR